MKGVLIGTPCYGGMVTEGYFSSCMVVRRLLLSDGIPHDWLTLRNESLVQRGRNVIAASFLKETEFDRLLFIDADIVFDYVDIVKLLRLVEAGADVAVGPYRMKKPGAPLAAWRNGALGDIGDEIEPFEVDYAGTGFMMIPRATLERICELPEIAHEEGEIGKAWAFFDTGVVDDGVGPFYCSEDYWFCRTVRRLGMKIMMDPSIRLGHIGSAVY